MRRPASPVARIASLVARRNLLKQFRGGDRLEARFDAVLDLRLGELLLDVGCGGGHFLGRLRQAGHAGRLVGVDLEPALVRRASQDNDGVEFRQGNVLALPFEDETFDVVTVQFVLDHVSDRKRGLEEIRRVLKPGGRLITAANAFGHLHELWVEIADVTRGDQELGPLWQDAADLRREEILLSSARECFEEVDLHYLQGDTSIPSTQAALYLFDTYRESYWRISGAAWNRARKGLEKRLAELGTTTIDWRLTLRVVVVRAVRK
jgi:SAM-dependent methyltransferase